ncbi:manganese catalase family protein [Mesorhizobium australicum]|uniref:Manganese catalase family protein n=1 Tax=Mesorhizobium australicum TaxID=536018 RepID=A0ACC6SUW5_9HYPH|nr:MULTISPECIES: manganese catalase family protein [unclassified Mesorhizobium]ESY87012.1 catalase [Mesorhizobium sp. LNHC220B00]ESY95421.1 catalase [Mesorhizobium sp. LNHC229A00]ESY98965.1 catalase [Mesorhizobium sp. LNHC209A00]
MYYTDKKLQFPVQVETPNPIFARALQQAIGGVEGEIRVALQYFFQAWGCRGPAKYRDLLLNTATEELAHIEMLATAVALNLEGAPLSLQEDVSSDAVGGSVLNGMNFRHILSTGLAALPENSNGVPFNASHVYASGNLAADMVANVTAEGSGRVLATRLYNMTNDAGMKDMLSFLIARDTMHQQQWLAAIEDMGGLTASLPVPNSFPREKEHQDVSYAFINCFVEGVAPAQGRWSEGPSMDGKGEFSLLPGAPMGEEPMLSPPRPSSGAQSEQMFDRKAAE